MTDPVKTSNDQEQTSSRLVVAIIGVVLAGIVLLFGNDIVGRLQETRSASLPPEFSFQFEGELAPNTYEVTTELAYAENLMGDFQVTVSADYRGNTITGPVNVLVVKPDGTRIEKASWEDFRLSHEESRSFSLTASELFEYSNVPVEPKVADPAEEAQAEATAGKFDIEIEHNNQILARTEVNVLHTPWFHSTRIADPSIRQDDSVSAYVTIANFGSPADFSVQSLLYESTTTDDSSLKVGPEGWWPGKSWELIGRGVVMKSEVNLEQNESTTVEINVPSEYFVEGNTYVLETYAVKRLRYLDFPDGVTWFDSEEAWRARDQPDYSTIVVLAP